MDDDEDFLFQLAAAEADAIQNSTKRRRDNHHDSDLLHPPKLPAAAADEGSYTAALKGSKSMTWQHQKQTNITSPQSRVGKPVGPGNVFGNQGSDGGDACFKCGKSGHWARDCVAVAPGGGSDPEIPEKSCSCGLGTCLVLTANTEKNRGRKFYRCPVRQENGGCGFFEWCDSSSTGGNTTSGVTQSYAPTSSFPDLPCPCGAASCLVLTAKTEKNMGQQFYRCPANQENSCRFFKWCTDQTVAAGPALCTYNSRASSDTFETSSKSYGATGGSSCFKCGKAGHWANDCTVPSNGDSGGRLTSSPAAAGGGGTCYKYGLAGHWARECGAPSMGDSGGRPASSGGGGTCYKCNQAGHWAKDCTSSQNTSARQKW